MSTYSRFRWWVARVTRFNFVWVLIALGVMALASIALSYVSLTAYISPSTQRQIELILLGMAAIPMLPMLWSRLHMSRKRSSVQLYIENRDVVSVHWTPLPEWLGATRGISAGFLGGSVTSVPRRAALVQLREWIAHAQAHGFRELRMDSPLFVMLDAGGTPISRSTVSKFVEPLLAMPEVERVAFSKPAPLPALRATAYRLSWPTASKRSIRSSEGHLLTAGVVVHLAVVGV